MTDQRPDPDRVLAQIRSRETGSGRLQVFLGMCAGVGKTYAMLEAAQERRRDGEPVLIGVVETHGRAETEELVEGLEILPRRAIEYRGIQLQEFDLDRTLARRPTLLIIDELAHSNAPGSRHDKRWQDVQELLAAGYDVYTALNVQHIESLNDAVAQITGIKMRETVPDVAIERADDVVLVDLPPEDLLIRLREGKVYLGDQAERALEHFFKPEKLVALRELALRFVAERVGAKVRLARHLTGATAIWPTRERLLVGVGSAPSSARLVRSTKRLAGLLQAPWTAMTVETAATEKLPLAAQERIAEHLRLAERLGAEVTRVTGDRIPEALLREARARNVTKIVVGKPTKPWWREWLRPSLVTGLVRRSGDIDVYVIRGEETEPLPKLEAAPRRPPVRPAPYVWSVAAVIACSVLAIVMDRLHGWFGLTDVAMVYVAGVAVVALAGSRRAAILASALSVLAFNFFFVPPRYTLDVDSPQYLVTFTLLFGVSLLVSTLAIRLREQRDLAKRGEGRAEAMQRFTMRLASARDQQAMAQVIADEAGHILSLRTLVFLPSPDGGMLSVPVPTDEKELAVARWVLDHRQSAGRGTQTLSLAKFHHTPIGAGEVCHGVLAVELPEEQHILLPEQRQLLDALSRQAFLAFDVQRLEEEQRRAQLEAENERLRASILSAVSHDLRTPLASIIGSASGLVEQPESYSADTRQELLASILDEAGRLNRLVSNLLEITRLEGGGLRLQREAVSVVDIVSAALQTTRRRIGNRAVEVAIPNDLPFVLVDELLIQQVLLNLLDNAMKFSSDTQPISISARVYGPDVAIEVADRGPGIQPGEAEKVFDKFFRGSAAAGARGSGLGLSICRGIVEAHGGKITADNRPGGGALFRFTLPATEIDLPPENPE